MPVEVHLIPFQELSTGQAAKIRNEAIIAVRRMASSALNLTEDRLLTRDIQPKDDLDYTYASWREITGSTAATYETMSTGTMGDDRYMAIYGVKDDSSYVAVTQLRITVGGSQKVIWMLENLYPLYDGGPRIGFSSSVITIPQNTPYTIERYVDQTQQGAHILLKGVICERIGKTISPG